MPTFVLGGLYGGVPLFWETTTWRSRVQGFEELGANV